MRSYTRENKLATLVNRSAVALFIVAVRFKADNVKAYFV